MHDSQIGERVADLLALVEARTADDPIGQAERDEAILELAHLERGAHQDGDLVERVRPAGAVVALQLLDLLADRARLFLGIPAGGDLHLLARLVLGAQRLAEPALVVGDEVRGGGEDMGGAAVVALQPDDLGARENRSRSAGCCRPRRRASRRSTGRRRRRSRCSSCGVREVAVDSRGRAARVSPIGLSSPADFGGDGSGSMGGGSTRCSVARQSLRHPARPGRRSPLRSSPGRCLTERCRVDGVLHGDGVLCPSRRSHRYCATLVS